MGGGGAGRQPRARPRRRGLGLAAAALVVAAAALALAAAALLVAGGPVHEWQGDSLGPERLVADWRAWPGAPLPAAFAHHYLPCGQNVGNFPPTSFVFVPPSGLYKINDTITIKIVTQFGIQSQWVFSHTRIELETGDTDRFALPSHYTGNDLYYVYTVQPGDYSDDLDYRNSTSLYWRTGNGYDALTMKWQDVIYDSEGDAIDCWVSDPGTSNRNNVPSLSVSGNVTVDGIVPRVANVTIAPPGGGYVLGDSAEFDANFNETVVYSGAAPTLRLDLGNGETRSANYTSGNNTSTLTFAYKVQAGDAASDMDYDGRWRWQCPAT